MQEKKYATSTELQRTLTLLVSFRMARYSVMELCMYQVMSF